MIQDGFDYGDGYEKATEPGPDVEYFNECGSWADNTQYNTAKFPNEMFDKYAFAMNRFNLKYRNPIKPKDEKMEEPMIDIKSPITPREIKYGANGCSQYCIPIAEAERLGEEAKRIKAEIAKREEIGPGDWFNSGNILTQCAVRENPTYLRTRNGTKYYVGNCKKLHPTPEVSAWLDSIIK